MTVSMLGRKVGMMRLYDGAGRVRAVTAIELGPNRVTQLRTGDRDGYEAVQIGHRGERARLNRPARGHLSSAGIEEPLSVLGEFRVGDTSEFSVGEELRVDRFEPGAFVDVTGVSRGRGFAGGVKRWGFHGGPKTHGQSDKHRGPGSIGAGTTPGRVWKGQKMAGHMGARRKTVRNLLVVLTDAPRNLLFVEGSVPGSRGGIVTVSPARRPALADFAPPEPGWADAADAFEAEAPAADEREGSAEIEEPDATAEADAAAEASVAAAETEDTDVDAPDAAAEASVAVAETEETDVDGTQGAER